MDDINNRSEEEDHVVQEEEDDESEALKKRGLEKMEKMKSFTNVVREQTAGVKAVIVERETDIKTAFDETVLQLNAKKKALLGQCEAKKRKLTDELCKQDEKVDDLRKKIKGAYESLANGERAAMLEGAALVVHTNMCKELQDMLDRNDPDESEPKQVTRQAEALFFTPCRLEDEHNLGMLNMKEWVLKKVANFTASGEKPVTMAQTKYGKMLVGYSDGGLEEFTVSSSQNTLLGGRKVYGTCVLSDSHYIVRDNKNNISRYSSNWNEISIKEFEMSPRISHCGSMDVDKNDNIYVGSCLNDIDNTIQMFTSRGGAPIGWIPCKDYKPLQICTMNRSGMLVVSDKSSVQVIDQNGTVKHGVIKKEGYDARPAVLYDDSILIGWRKGDLVNIDLYTDQLGHERTVLVGLECKTDCWALRQFSSGEIAFCCGSKLYVLRKS